jgi:hypothetical protein
MTASLCPFLSKLNLGTAIPVAIDHDPVNRTIGVGIVRSDPEALFSSVMRFDDVSFAREFAQHLNISPMPIYLRSSYLEAISEFRLPSNEELTALLCCTLSYNSDPSQYWVVGSEMIPDEDAPSNQRSSGNLTVCSLHTGNVLQSFVTAEISSGGVGALAVIDGKIVVAAGPGVRTRLLDSPY